MAVMPALASPAAIDLPAGVEHLSRVLTLADLPDRSGIHLNANAQTKAARTVDVTQADR